MGGCNWPIVWVAQCGQEIPDAIEIEAAAKSNARGDIVLQTSNSNLGEIRLEQSWSGFGDDLTSSLRDSPAPTDVARGNCKGAEDASVSNNPGHQVSACPS